MDSGSKKTQTDIAPRLVQTGRGWGRQIDIAFSRPQQPDGPICRTQPAIATDLRFQQGASNYRQRRLDRESPTRHAITDGANSDTIEDEWRYTSKILDEMRRSPQNLRFADLLKVCVGYFGEPRQSGTSHVLFKTPWPGDPRINIQNHGGEAMAYQVRQVLRAIDKLQEGKDEEASGKEGF